jgi:hypothetical protein
LQQAVGRPSQLERTPGLKALALEPDAGAVDLALDQRGSLDQPGDPLRRLDDLIMGDLGISG